MNVQQKNNPLLCDPQTGLCEIKDTSEQETLTTSSIVPQHQKVKLLYFTDPICSSCWAIEPQLRKLKLEYGNSFDLEYHMGGLLPDWSYNSGGISKPSDVAAHWDEVSVYYKMPIDGDVWLEDPLPSSYPPSIAFKAAQLQDQTKAVSFLRYLREMVFLKKKNIAKWEYLLEAAQLAGLDIKLFKNDYESKAKSLFEADLKLAKDLGVRGFPSIFFINQQGEQVFVYGSKEYSFFEQALLNVKQNSLKQSYASDWSSLFHYFSSLTAQEYALLSDTPYPASERYLKSLSDQGLLEVYTTKNGSIWYLKTQKK